MARLPRDESFVDTVVAGAVAALTGVISFGIFHTLWISDVPAVFVEGMYYVAPAALAIGWAIRRTRQAGRFRGGLLDGLLIGLLFWLTLIPYEIVGALWGPFSEPATLADTLGQLWIGVLGVPVGAAIGWALTRDRWATVAWALAALAVDLSLGGGLAFNGGRGAMLGLFFWMLPTHLLAGLVLVGVHALLGRGDRGLEVAGAAR